ncbi:MAG: winged helix-turn-helix transcriptional regulator [Desulfomonile tiedjei]|nr:winged helix-turn-helix transcriptional regulator [Desulfomonile tiedjei]
MTPRQFASLKIRAEVFRALGQPTRLGIVELLQGHDMQVGEIAERLCANVTSVSKHLGVLRGLGIVEGRKVGLKLSCTLSVPQLDTFMRCVEERVARRIIKDEAGCGAHRSAGGQE